MPTHHPKMIRQTKGKGRNIPKTSHPKTSHPKQPIPFHVHRSSLPYKACSAAIGVPTTLKNDILAIALTNHLIQMTLHWASSSGVYNPSIAFKIQEKSVFENILSHDNIPSSIEKPILLVRRHLHFIRSNFALRNYQAKIRHLEKQTNCRVKEEGKEEDNCIFEDNGFFQDDDGYPEFNHAPTVDEPPNPTNAPNTTPNTTFNTTDIPPAMPTLSPALPVILPKNKEQNVASVHFLTTIIRLKYANGPEATTGEQLQ
jgi:hypothetical protein